MVRGHVAHDGEAQPGAARVTTARPIDPVEALEDALVVARRDPDAVVLHRYLDPVAVCRAPQVHSTLGFGVLHCIVQEVVDGGHQLTAVAGHGDPAPDLADRQGYNARLGRGPHLLDGLADGDVYRDRLALGRLLGLETGEVEKVMDRATHTHGLGLHPVGEAPNHSCVLFVGQRLGEEPERTDGRLQLVTHVGHEVAAYGLQALAVGHVLDDRHPTHR